MSLITKKAKDVKKELEIDENYARGKQMTAAMIDQLNQYHYLDEKRDNALDLAILDDEVQSIKNPKYIPFKRGLVTFSPSSASKCERELYYKALKEERDVAPFHPYQRRWMRNGSAVHAFVQKDLLYSEKYLEDPAYTIVRMKSPASVAGRPAWEHNLKNVKHFEEHGFQIFGMMDGVLQYKDGSKVGFEFKTKSTTVAAIGDYKLKRPQQGHLEQVTAYSLLFGLDEFIMLYETLAKDGWFKGEEARPDLKAFYINPTKEMKDELIDKFIRVAAAVKAREIPEPQTEKCIFCPYKKLCEQERNGN